MRILLIAYDNDSYISVFPLGLAYVASACRDAGHDVEIYNQDVYHWPESHLTEKLDREHYDVVGVGVIGGYYQYRKLLKISEAINASKQRPYYMIGGHGPSPDPKYFLKKTGADVVVIGEGEETVVQLLEFVEARKWLNFSEIKGIAYMNGNSGKCIQTPRRELIVDIDSIAHPAWDLFPMDHYALLREANIENKERCMLVLSGRGCTFTCLQGDILIDTLELGKQKIKDLVGKDVSVLTRDKKTKNLIYAKALNISLTQKESELVRVHFDDDTFIDCTPDHRFMGFKHGNQHIKTEEKEIEAQDLKSGQSVRAIKYKKLKGYDIIRFGRQQEIKKHRLVMESFLKRKLNEDEHVHHIDYNKENNRIDNLLLTNKKNHVKEYHSTHLSERMKSLWKQGKLVGHPMSEENKNLHSVKMLKDKNPNWNNGVSLKDYYCIDCDKKLTNYTAKRCKSCAMVEILKRKKEINHKVVKVEKLSNKEDVYCMEVPGYDWFFANDVLVHNCNFCYRMDKGHRARSPESIIEEIEILKKTYDVSYIDFQDELLMSSVKRTKELCEAFIKAKLNVKWFCNGRLNYAKPEVLRLMREAGCVFINYGIESMDPIALKAMNKALTVKQITDGIENTLAADISPGYNIIFGNITETKESLQLGVDFLLKYDDHAQMRTIRPVTPYPGSPLYYQAIAEGKLKGCEDFYEHKHTNSDLLSVNFTDMSDDEFHHELCKANKTLIGNYFTHQLQNAKDNADNLYYEKDATFRGFRQS